MSGFVLALARVRAAFPGNAPAGFALVVAAAIVAGCGGGGGTPVQPIAPNGSIASPSPKPSPTPVKTASPSPTPSQVASATPSSPASPSAACAGTVNATIGAAGGTVTASASAGTFSEVVASGQFSASTAVSLGYVSQASLPAPLDRTTHIESGRRVPAFTQGAGNTYVLALCTTFGSAPASGITLTGTGVVPNSVAAGSQLNIAIYQGGTYVDVGTAQVTSTGNFQSTVPTLALPGITKSGTYLVYVPPANNTTQINLGFALFADDSSAGLTNGLQFAQIEKASGVVQPTPTTTFFPVTGGDLDGQSLTADASHGAVVDGSNTVYFFSGIPQNSFKLAAQTVDVTNYGGDGDSIASLPGGDQVVVTADDGAPLAVISGILAGTPAVADTIPNNGNDRDGLVISNDGTVLLARGQYGGTPGIDVYKVAQVAAHAGTGCTPSCTGTTSFSFTLVKTLVSGVSGAVSTPFTEDGRDGMAISPADPSRGLVVGADINGNPTIQLLTGLNGSSPSVSSSLRLRVPQVARRLGSIRQAPEPSAHLRPFAVTPSAGTELFAVAITPDGTTGYVSTDAGIVTVSGINTGTLAQAGSVYSPTLTVQGNTCPLTYGTTIGILPDGKYLVTIANQDYGFGTTCQLLPGNTNTTQGTGVLVTIPIGTGDALGAPVGQLIQTVSPFNDQMITH